MPWTGFLLFGKSWTTQRFALHEWRKVNKIHAAMFSGGSKRFLGGEEELEKIRKAQAEATEKEASSNM